MEPEKPALVPLPIDLAQAAFRPCPPNEKPRSWYACNGDDDPTVGLTCSDGQCSNPEHTKRIPCRNLWHRLPDDIKAALRP